MLNAANTLRRALIWVALLNLGYFLVEFSVALRIDAVSLFADSVDFLEDAAVNLLVLMGLAWSLRRKTQLALLLAALMLVPAIATLWMAYLKWHTASVPNPQSLTVVGVGALVVNVSCAFLLAKVQASHGSLTRAAFLSARNDAMANVAIIGAGASTWVMGSHWPDLVVGLGILILNLGAAHEVFVAARKERAAQW